MEFPKWVYLSADPVDGFIVEDQTELDAALEKGAKLTPAPEAWAKAEDVVPPVVPVEGIVPPPDPKGKK